MDDDFYSNPHKLFASLTAANPHIPIPSLPSLAEVKREAAPTFAQNFRALEPVTRYSRTARGCFKEKMDEGVERTTKEDSAISLA